MPKQSTLKFITYNIGLGGKKLPQIISDFSRNEKLAKPDLICLQESSFSKVSDAQKIAESLGEEYQFIHAEAQEIFKKVVQANAIVYNSKKLDLISSEVIKLDQQSKLTSFLKSQERNFLVQTFLYKSKKIRVYNTHLDLHGGWGLKRRQVGEIIARIKSNNHSDLTIFCGDLNTVTYSADVLKSRKKFVDYFSARLRRLGFKDTTLSIPWTQHVQNINPRARFFWVYKAIKSLGINLEIRQKTDYIFVKAAHPFAVENGAYSVETNGSDHLPVVLEISYNEKNA
jgi:endonuclease/exonuclease/phosphatase family metal-dependent hydrolase